MLRSMKESAESRAANGKRRSLPGLAVADGYTQHPFDIEFGVKTSGLVAGRNLECGHRHDPYNTAYYGVAPSVLESLLKRWRKSRPVAPIDQFTFVDLGSGMGRAVLLASKMPFHEVVGVELNPTLARIGSRNAAMWRAAGRAQTTIRLACGDAVEARIPEGPCVVFLFNPFGAVVMARLLRALAKRFAGRPGCLDLLYVNNEHESVLEHQYGFVRLFHGKVKRSRADAIADHRILANQPDGEYASSNWEDCSIWRWVG